MTTQVSKMTTFASLIEKCASFDANKHDSTVKASKLHFEPDGRLTVPASMGNLSLGMEDLALGQLSERMGRHFWNSPKRVIPQDFYRQLYGSFPGHFANLTNELLGKAQGNLLVRGYANDVRALLSDQYAPLDNADLLEMASIVLEDDPFEIVEVGKYYRDNDGVQRDEISIRVVVKHMSPKDEGGYGLGVLIRNGETGGGASQVRPLVMRTSCMNSLIFKNGENGEHLGLSLHHRGSKVAKRKLLALAIAEALPMAEQGLEKFLTTKEVEVDLSAVIANLGKDQGWSEEMKLTVARDSENQDNVYGLINGMTYAAHQMEIDASRRFDLESLASLFVYQPKAAVTLSKVK